MRFPILCAAAVTLALLAGSSQSEPPKDPNIASTRPLTPEDELKSFHLPPGFAVERVAAEPDIHKPINMNFDDRGRLWVTDSVEYPFPGKGDKPRDSVKILEDFGPDGRARKISTYADGLNIPIGVLPLSHGALIYSIPNIYRLRDTQGDGVGGGSSDHAVSRKVLYGSYGFRDTHGMTGSFTWGFDGWVYACHGFSNTSTVKAADGSAITMQSGNTYRMKVDGSHIEPFTHGQVNPFGLCFDPLGNLYSADCHTKPIMMLLRGAYYDSFGKAHDGLGYAPEMIDVYNDSTAIAGIAYYAADHFPAAYVGNAFIGDVVTNCVNEFRLTWHGSSPKAVKHEFLRSSDPWFRPVDVKLGPDGALYVADFYNRIIGHYEVPLDHPGRDRERGRIWRIVYRGADGKGKPVSPRADWTKATVSELVQDLGHPNLVVRMKATNELVERGGEEGVAAVRTAMKEGSNAWQRMHGLWVLDRKGALDDALLEAAAKDREAGVRVHAMRVLSERQQLAGPQHQWAVAGLKDEDATVRRCAADALGRHPREVNVRPLLYLLHAVPADDTHLRHVVRMALRDQLRHIPEWAEFPAPVLFPTEKDMRAIADVCPGLPTDQAVLYLLRYLQGYREPRANLMRYVHHIARYGTDKTDSALLSYLKGAGSIDLEQQAALFKELEKGTQERGGKLSDLSRTYATELAGKLLASAERKNTLAGIELAGSLKLASVQGPLANLVGAKSSPEQERVAAMDALAAIDPKHNVALFGRILGDGSESITLREQAARTLAHANQPEAQAQLLQHLPTVLARLQNVIAIELAGSRAGAEKLLEAVAAGKASARLLQEKAVEVKLQESKLPELKARLAKLTAGLPAADARLHEQITRRHDGFAKAKRNADQGLKVYEKNCAICHQLGGKGAKIGPQLDGIGIRGVDRLLEDILDPNRNVDQAFRSTTLALKNGTLVSGLLLREEGEIIIMADAQGKEVRVPKKTVEEKTVSQLSPMPANFADQVSEAEFYDLIAYLLAQRQKPADKGK